MSLLAVKVRLLKKFGVLVIALRRCIPDAPKSMHTVVNPTLDTVLVAR
jgi:hypothetical protein